MIDMHSHTIYSDGSYTVSTLLQESEKLGLTLLSITDHDTIQAYYELNDPKIRNIFSGNIIPGVEITTTYKGEIIEILGYGFDLETMNNLLKHNVLTYEEKQLKEYELIKRKYIENNIIFNENNIQFNPKIESCRPSFAKELKRYPENHKLFLNKESLITDSGYTRNELYNPKSALYVDESNIFPSLEKVIDIIHESGGLAFLAHTFSYSQNIIKELINILDNYSLDGLECYYTTYNDKQEKYLVELCKQRALYKSGGSDCHGDRKIKHHLGTGNGNLNIDEALIADWVSIYYSGIKYVNKMKMNNNKM